MFQSATQTENLLMLAVDEIIQTEPDQETLRQSKYLNEAKKHILVMKMGNSVLQQEIETLKRSHTKAIEDLQTQMTLENE